MALENRHHIIVSANVLESIGKLEPLEEPRIGIESLDGLREGLVCPLFAEEALYARKLDKRLDAPLVITHEPPGMLQCLLTLPFLNERLYGQQLGGEPLVVGSVGECSPVKNLAGALRVRFQERSRLHQRQAGTLRIVPDNGLCSFRLISLKM